MKNAIKKLPYTRRLHAEIGQLKEVLETWHAWLPPPGISILPFHP
jgi:hypothetical protein